VAGNAKAFEIFGIRLDFSCAAGEDTRAPVIRRGSVPAERREPLEIEALGFLPKAAPRLLQRSRILGCALRALNSAFADAWYPCPSVSIRG
jgi:hypothetical protein